MMFRFGVLLMLVTSFLSQSLHGLALAPVQDLPDLIVSLRDSADRPVGGITVSVRAVDGHELAHAATDAAGRVSFGPLRVSTVRVAVSGALATGIALRQPGADASGIWLLLGAPPTRLDLLVEPNGLVRPTRRR
jgi:hypothetical protein